MINKNKKNNLKFTVILLITGLIIACSEENPSTVLTAEDSGPGEANIQIAQPQSENLLICEELVQQFNYSNTRIDEVTSVAAGELGSSLVGEHCLVTGMMNPRISEIDGNNYGIGFEMRLPVNWNGKFFYHANGGVDGFVRTATGNLGGGQTTTALELGFAVINSDAGHQGPAPFFGIDPQARLDYGYQAVGTLTPMAKSLITTSYGRAPERSYFAGCSNGGRHAMVAAARYADQYDGFLAGNPGFNLPKAATAQLYAVQQFSLVANSLNEAGQPDIRSAFSQTEMDLIAAAVLERCDSLDGIEDGIVADTVSCQATFDLQRDVPTCPADRDGSCLTQEQKTVMDNIMNGATNSAGELLYSSFPYDPGMAGSSWAGWKFNSSQSQNRDPGATSSIFTTPPGNVDEFMAMGGYQFAMNFDMDTDAPRIYATDDIYTESPMSFMTPPDPNNMETLSNSGAKLLVYHGVADGVFSSDDTARWYSELDAQHNGSADEFARLFLVPGMGHCSSGPSADQFDMFSALVAWVEEGEAPAGIAASVRGEDNEAGVNDELPEDWSENRTRLLCPFPEVARYSGSGDSEDAASFNCEAP